MFKLQVKSTWIENIGDFRLGMWMNLSVFKLKPEILDSIEHLNHKEFIFETYELPQKLFYTIEDIDSILKRREISIWFYEEEDLFEAKLILP